jgi:hypothetical protein
MMELKLLANHIDNQVILIHFEFFIISWRKMLVKQFVDTKDEDPYSNRTDVIYNLTPYKFLMCANTYLMFLTILYSTPLIQTKNP